MRFKKNSIRSEPGSFRDIFGLIGLEFSPGDRKRTGDIQKMFNRSVSFRFIVIGLSIVAIGSISAAANWGTGLRFLFPQEQVAAAEVTSATTSPLGATGVAVSGSTGADGNYGTLAGAFAALNANAVQTGNTITISVQSDTTETTTAVLNAGDWASITISPSGGAPRTISGAIAAGSPLIDLNGADNVTIDGLNAGGNALTISNTTASATSGTSTIRFIGGATNNVVTNSTILGSFAASIATNGGNIFFSTDANTPNGNDNNTISNNNIGPAGTNMPTKGVYCNGSTTTTAIGNSGILITNNNIFDVFGPAVTSSAIYVAGGCNTDSITNNRIYQTGTRTWTTGATHSGINIQNSTSTSGAQGFTITGNTIGYASNTQTGTYTLTGAGNSAKFLGIVFNGIVTGTSTNVSNNTVANISMTGVTGSGTTTSSPFTAILLQEGNVISNGNTIGSQTAAGSLVFSTTTTSSTDVYGIHNFTSNAWTANNNNVGGISVTNLGASGTFLVYGMRAFTGSTVTWSATGNTVGGTVSDSIQLNATGTSSQVVGMFTSNAPAVLTSNTIRNLTSNIGTGTTTGASVIGINITTSTPNHTLSRNTIFNLNNTNTTVASVVTGIQFTGSTANVVERNLIYSINSATTSTAAEVNGIRVAGGTTVYRNNMIRVGTGTTNAIGTGSTTGGVNGINEPLGTDSFFHNSVYVGGAPTAGVGPSYAFNSSQTVNTRSFRDNVFFNARSNNGATGKNYAVRVGGTSANPSGLTINNNVYFTTGSGAVFGYFNSLDVADLSAWKTAVGQDAASYFADPKFIDPTSATPDLHINASVLTVVEGNGADVGVVDDYDGQTRATLTPVDIGADAGNFMGLDLAPPSIGYTALANTSSTANRALSVSLSDVTGVATGGLAPRIYFNKNAGSYSSIACSLTSGTTQSGTWNCPIDNSLIGGVAATDVVRYFVVAQDTVGNIAANPGGGFSGTDVNTVTTPPTTPNQYRIVAPISGSFNVGTGETYTSLTNAGGIFEAINNSEVTGNITINITSDLTGELGTNGINAFAAPYSITISPSGGARSITGSTASNAMIRTDGASSVTIDGSVGGVGSDRSLTIENTNTTSPQVVRFGSTGTAPVTNNVLKNCVIRNGVNTSSAVVVTDTTGVAGYFSNITIQNNDIQKAYVGIFTNAAVLAGNGSGLLITQNKMDTSGANSLRLVGAYVQGADGATVSNNIIGNFDNTAAENDTGIWLATGAVNTTVSGNSVTALGYSGTSGNAPYGIRDSGGAAASGNNLVGNTVSNISTNGSTQVFGIEDSSGGTIIQRNNVQGIVNANTGTFGAYGIDVSAGNNVVLKNNFVSNVTGDMTGGAAFSTTFGIFGIRIGAGTGHQIYHNSVNLYGARAGTATTSLLTAAFAVVGTTSTGMDVRNNIFANNITGGTTSIANVSAYLPSGGTSAMNLTWNNNSYYFGADAARQGAGQAGTTAGTNFFTTLPLMAAYTSGLSPASTNDNASLSSMGAVPFLSANDLHIPLGSAEIDAGAVLASVLVDIDGDPRPYGAGYDIGADEQPDVTPPDTQILTHPTNPSNSTDATFTFSGTDSVASAVASFECDLDGSGFSTCTSPKTYSGLGQGSHTFQVRAKDGAGNIDPTPASYGWVVDAIAPDTQILTNPPNPSNSADASFTFTGTDSLGRQSLILTFECKLDTGAFSACTSPQNYTSLSQGVHNFQVRAIDFAGNIDPTPASYSWTLDAIAPDTQILSSPPDPSNSSDATFTFSASDSLGFPAPTFECKLDAEAFAACTTPKNYTSLADGPHTFQVRAVDFVGNIDPTPASYSWTISTSYTGPVTVTATAGTAGPTDYPTVKDAFDAINAGTHQGDIIVNVVTNTTETASAVLNSSGAGSASYTSVLVRPYNDGVTVSGATLQGRGLIELNGADNVTIDGDNPNTPGANRNLTLQNTAANTVTFTSVVRIVLAATVVNSADNDVIKNLNIVGSSTGRNISTATSTTGTENTTFGVFAGPGGSTVSGTTAPSAITSVSTSVGAGATAANLLISNNSVVTAARGISANGSATTVFPGLQITANDIGNPTAGSADQVTSIGITAQGSTNGFIAANSVWVEGYVGSSTATQGINVGVNSATGTFTIDSNRVNRVKNNNGGSWSAFGINLGGGSNHVVQNNFVSGVINDQTAGTGAFSTTFGAFGIRVASGTGHKIYQNSVNLYGVMGGVTSTDLTAAFGITSTTLTGVDVRNNIFANRITAGNPTGTRHVAVYLPSGATVSMNLTDNNNAYFSGTDANDRLAQTGTTFGTGEYLAANFDPSATTPASNFRAYTSPLSAAGTNDNASFVKTTPPPFATASDLHIPNSTVTQLESGGAAVGVTVDIDGDTRPNGTAPDIGADEFTGLLPPANDIAANSFIVPTDGGVLPAGTSGQPQASFTNVGLSAQTNVSVQFAANGPMGYTFTDTQVISTINPGSTVTVTFATAPTLVAGSYTMSAAVITSDSNSANDVINGSFTAVPPVSGTVTVGGGGNFASLTNPGGLFDTINTLGTSGPVVANISADLTGETGAVALNEFGSSLTIKPSGGPRIISGTSAASSGLIILNGADNVTFDGSLSGGTDRSLTITNNQLTTGIVIWMHSAGSSNGANNNTIKNCVINGAPGPNSPTVAGVLTGSGVTLGGDAESPNSNNTIQNNWIYRVQNGLYLRGGTTAPFFDSNWNVNGNTFGSTVSNDKNIFRGMLIGNASNFTINGNTVNGIQSTTTTTAAMSGIQVALLVDGGFVVNNTIRDIKNVSASGTGAFGIQVSSTSAASNVTIANNFVADITGLGSATATSNGFGLVFNAATGGYKVYHNSVNMSTNQASGTTAAMLVTSAVTAAGALDVRDNIFANTQTTGATRYGVYSTAAASVFSSINYNDYFAQNVGFIGGSAQVSLANWQAATTQDANSFAVDPMFVSSTDLHLALGSPMIDQAFTLPAVTTDIDGQTRPIGAANDIGADEWIAAVTISGRLTTPGGQGIKNVKVVLSDGGLATPRIAISGPFGYYSFTDVPTGQTYTLNITAKRFVFNPNVRLITPYTDVTSADFVSDPPTFAP